MITVQRVAALRCDGVDGLEPGTCEERYTEVSDVISPKETRDEAEERIRHQARQAGWSRSRPWPGGPLRDYCPSCTRGFMI